MCSQCTLRANYLFKLRTNVVACVIIKLMNSHVNTSPVKKVLTDERFYAGLLLVIGATVLNRLASALIQLNWPDRQPIQDTLFEILPYIPWLDDWTDIANIFSLILIFAYASRRWRLSPYIIITMGFGYLLRAGLILLNPFGGPLGNVVHYGLSTIHQHGQFPSGHTFFVTIVYLLIDKKDVAYKRLALLSVWVEVVALILSHGHYGIDIAGGLMLGYTTYHIMKDREAKLTVS